MSVASYDKLSYAKMRFAVLSGVSLLSLALYTPVIAQDACNYVLTVKNLRVGGAHKLNHYRFYDGLGRQTTEAQSGFNGADRYVYSHRKLTAEGSVDRSWLPVIGGNNHGGVISCIDSLCMEQYTDTAPYDDFTYDPRGRIVETHKSGAIWKSRPAKVSYGFNGAGEVKRYTVANDVTHRLTEDGCYAAGSLYRVQTENEDGIKVTVYTDPSGKKILERRGDDTDTYYVYGAYDRLIYVLMPGYQHNSNKDLQAYQYRYDAAGNMIKKKIPGCDWVQYWYDNQDRCVAVQDGVMRSGTVKLYRFTLYDVFGRVAVQGTTTSSPAGISDGLVRYEKNSGGIGNTDYRSANGGCMGIDVENIEIVNYYDGYEFLAGSSGSSFAGLANAAGSVAKGGLTGQLALASNGERTATVNSYDIKGNLTESNTKGIGGFTEKVEHTYSYTNKPLLSKKTLTDQRGDVITYESENEYDTHRDILTAVSHKVKVGDVETEKSRVTYHYDDLGRLTGIKRPSTEDVSEVRYEYDMHGWITGIAGSQFQESIHYNTGMGTPLYSGNISSVMWSGLKPEDTGYRFSYDGLNRLLKSEYGENGFTDSAGNYSETMEYDANGNLTALERNGLRQDNSHGAIDKLRMGYHGNRLISVEEEADAVHRARSVDVKQSSTEFAYNANGSLTRDGTRRIQKIEYDLNNNPVRIQFENGSETQYVYGAGGDKLRVIHLTAAENGDIHSRPGYVFSGQFLQTDTIDYAMGGAAVYRNGRFNRLMFDGGYVEGVYRNNCVMPPVYPGLPADELAGGAVNINENGAEAAEGAESAVNAEAEVAGGADVGRGLFSLIQDITGAPAQSVFSSYLAELKYRYYTKDHLGNNREVVGMNGEICQLTDYYPYGMPHTGPESECNPEAQPYKYNGKELDGVHGLNTYDYGARQYGFAIPRWDRVDPLCEKYYHASPYAYCLGNPVRYLDLFGEEPVYSMKGLYLGSTKEGFTGNILIYDGNIPIDVSKMSVTELLKQHGGWVDSFDMVRSWGYFGMSGINQSKIWNHIVSQFEGMKVYDEVFSIKKLHNRKITYRNIEDASWLTTFSNNGNIMPMIEGSANYPYESTVENIASSIIVHEWYSHGVKHFSDRKKNHNIAYKNVINFEKLWKNTSLIYKLFIIMQYEKYNRKENNIFNENPFDIDSKI